MIRNGIDLALLVLPGVFRALFFADLLPSTADFTTGVARVFFCSDSFNLRFGKGSVETPIGVLGGANDIDK